MTNAHARQAQQTEWTALPKQVIYQPPSLKTAVTSFLNTERIRGVGRGGGGGGGRLTSFILYISPFFFILELFAGSKRQFRMNRRPSKL